MDKTRKMPSRSRTANAEAPPPLDVKGAVAIAFQYINDLFSPEKITNLGLEEIRFDDKRLAWNVTVGFSRPWDYPTPTRNAIMAHLGEDRPPIREYKIVRVDTRDRSVKAVENRPKE